MILVKSRHVLFGMQFMGKEGLLGGSWITSRKGQDILSIIQHFGGSSQDISANIETVIYYDYEDGISMNKNE